MTVPFKFRFANIIAFAHVKYQSFPVSLGWSTRRSAQDDGVAAVRIMDG